jgi:hypothetical protein
MRMVSSTSGERRTLRNWCRNREDNVWELKDDTVRKRLDAGFTIEQALALPPHVKRAWRQSDSDVRKMLANGRLAVAVIASVCGRSREEVKRLAYDTP